MHLLYTLKFPAHYFVSSFKFHIFHLTAAQPYKFYNKEIQQATFKL